MKRFFTIFNELLYLMFSFLRDERWENTGGSRSSRSQNITGGGSSSRSHRRLRALPSGGPEHGDSRSPASAPEPSQVPGEQCSDLVGGRQTAVAGCGPRGEGRGWNRFWGVSWFCRCSGRGCSYSADRNATIFTSEPLFFFFCLSCSRDFAELSRLKLYIFTFVIFTQRWPLPL